MRKFEAARERKERDQALALGVPKVGHIQSRPRELLKDHLKQTKLNKKENIRRVVGFEANNNDVFIPDMVDYEKIISAGLSKLKRKNYDSWSMLVKLCFDNPHSAKQRRSDGRTSNTDVNPVELMRFHPVLNKLDIRTVKMLLEDAKLCKLNANTLLYADGEENQNWYLVLFGALVLHHERLGALGVLSMEHTAGEESIIGKEKTKIDSAYAQVETYLLEMRPEKWEELRTLLLGMG